MFLDLQLFATRGRGCFGFATTTIILMMIWKAFNLGVCLFSGENFFWVNCIEILGHYQGDMLETYLFSTFIRWDFYFLVICKLICKWNYLTLPKVLGFWINLINKNFQRVDKKNILFNEKNTIVFKLSKILEFKSLLTLIFWTTVNKCLPVFQLT